MAVSLRVFVTVFANVPFFAEDATGFCRLRRFAVGASRISVIAWCKGCSLLCFFSACVISEYPSVRWGYV